MKEYEGIWNNVIKSVWDVKHYYRVSENCISFERNNKTIITNNWEFERNNKTIITNFYIIFNIIIEI